jgi:hypothetical protein
MADNASENPMAGKFFDHRLRRDESFGQKADYILHNPVRAGFVEKIEDWPYIWISEVD